MIKKSRSRESKKSEFGKYLESQANAMEQKPRQKVFSHQRLLCGNIWNRMQMSIAKHNAVEETQVSSELLWVASVEPKSSANWAKVHLARSM